MFDDNGKKLDIGSDNGYPRKTPNYLPIGLFNTHPETQNPPVANGKKNPPSGGTVITARMKQSGKRALSQLKKMRRAKERVI